MTNLEAIYANISDAHGVVLTKNHFVKALHDQGLSATDAYEGDAAAIKAIDIATVKLYEIILASSSISEGGLSYSVDKNEVRAEKERLEGIYGLTVDKKNRVNVVRPW